MAIPHGVLLFVSLLATLTSYFAGFCCAFETRDFSGRTLLTKSECGLLASVRLGLPPLSTWTSALYFQRRDRVAFRQVSGGEMIAKAVLALTFTSEPRPGDTLPGPP